MYKKQQDRKRRKNPFEPQAEERYFRHNEGTTDYYSHSTVTVDRIVMDVKPVSGGSGLPTGAPAVTNNVLQTIDFAYSGTISELCRNGANYFTGIMANVKYYFGGVQIHGYDIKSNSNDIPDTIGSNDAAVVNPSVDDWQVYTQQSTGEWLGQELVANGGFDNGVDNWVSFDPDGAIHGEDGYCVVTPVNMVNSARGAEQLIPTTIGSTIRLSGFIDATEWGAGSPHIQKRDPSVTMSGVLSGTSGISSGEFVATATSSKIWLRCDGLPTNLTWRVLHDNVSAREVLNVA